MSILQRIRDAFTPPPAPPPATPLPPPEGARALGRAMSELHTSAAELRERIQRPMPNRPDLAAALREARRNAGRPISPGESR